jgi:hypothetical protein
MEKWRITRKRRGQHCQEEDSIVKRGQALVGRQQREGEDSTRKGGGQHLEGDST